MAVTGDSEGHARTAQAKSVSGRASTASTSSRCASTTPSQVDWPHDEGWPEQLTCLQEAVACAGVAPGSSEAPRGAESGGKPLYDVLTIRSWFNEMDSDHSGHISKSEWFEFLRKNPEFKAMILNGSGALPPKDRFSAEAILALKDEAKLMRRLLKIWREIDTDGNGTLEWEEFVEIFRRSGNLLEYREQDTPKVRLAQIITNMHEGRVQNDQLVEFERLAKSTIHGTRRKSLEVEALKVIESGTGGRSEVASQVALRIERRHSAEEAASRNLQTPRQERRSSIRVES